MTRDVTDLKAVMAVVADGAPLSEAEAETAFDIMMSGDATPAQMGGLLMALRVRGETVEEITGAVRAMRGKMLRVRAPDGAIDVVGTGGDASQTYNISTAAALVVAGCGVPVAKHGNRAASSKCLVERSIREAHIGFLMAPRHHSAMRHVGGVRVELGTRTIFNILGPLSNPAEVKRLMVGAFARRWIEPMATVLGKLGAERAWVVHGADGLDELTTTGPSHVAEYRDGGLTSFEVAPEDAGLTRAPAAALKGADPDSNAAALSAVLGGQPGPYRDIVLYNAAAALVVAGAATDLREGAEMAAEAVDSGNARAALETMVAISNSPEGGHG
jgi:anthranilate phosphoribosyltransferase